MSPTVTHQLVRAGKVACSVAAVTPMALETVNGASGSMPGFAVSSRGPALICLVPGGICGSTVVGATLRRRAPFACAGGVAGLEPFMLRALLCDTIVSLMTQTSTAEGSRGRHGRQWSESCHTWLLLWYEKAKRHSDLVRTTEEH